MRTLKPAFGVIGALMPVLYCGSLLYYFFDVSGSVEGAQELGLGPTLIGLGAGGLLFCAPLIIKLMRIFREPPAPGSGGRPGGPTDDTDDGFDADAAIARYLAQRSEQGATNVPAARPAQAGGPARGFGRRIR